jgi:hypothetical protein
VKKKSMTIESYPLIQPLSSLTPLKEVMRGKIRGMVRYVVRVLIGRRVMGGVVIKIPLMGRRVRVRVGVGVGARRL